MMAFRIHHFRISSRYFIMFCCLFILSLLEYLHGFPRQSNVNLRIINGFRSEEPFVLKLRTESVVFSNETLTMKKGNSCTASLIRPQYILTAAHCFKSKESEPYVTYGCFDLKSHDCKKVAIIDWEIHPDFDGKTHLIDNADIAVGKLEHVLKEIEPIYLPVGENMKWIPSGRAYLVGYGRTETGEETRFQLATYGEISSHLHHDYWRKFIAVHFENSGTGPGDSGGPLIINRTIYGVLKGRFDQYPNCQKFSCSGYASVNFYRDFINTSIRKLHRR